LRPLLAGICGSDLAILGGEASPSLGALSSAPFVPGHEVVAEVVEGRDGFPAGTRVVVEPLLSCAVRGVQPPCPRCAAGEPQGCESVVGDGLGAGLQTGFCASTGGGWATELVAHTGQLHAVPAALDDRDAILVEPLSCALHAVLRSRPAAGDRVLVLGAGTLGLLVIAALVESAPGVRIIAAAKHPHQRRLAAEFGAVSVVTPDQVLRAVRFETRARMVNPVVGSPFLLGGVDITFECTGTQHGLAEAIACTRAQGSVVMVGMPSRGDVDLALAWQKELQVRGAYAYGMESTGGATRRRTFELALAAAGQLQLGRLLADPYPLDDYREAVTHAAAAGSRSSVKVAFAPTAAATGGRP